MSFRNVVVLGHSHDGKTTLCEAMLRCAGALPSGASGAEGSIFDFEPEERAHHMGISLAFAHCDWNDSRINIIDVPGLSDFAGEIACGCTAADCAILTVAATGDVAVGSEAAWETLNECGLPSLIAVTKMDKDNADYRPTVEAIRRRFGKRAVSVAVPIVDAGRFEGWIDLINDVAYSFRPNGRHEKRELPQGMRDVVERAHIDLVDAVAETDDSLLERYLAGEELEDQAIRDALHAAVLQGKLTPVVPVAASEEKGVAMLLDAITRFMPGPEERTYAGHDGQGNDVLVTCDAHGPLAARIVKTTVDSFGKQSYVKVLRGTLRSGGHPFDERTAHEQRFAQLGRPAGKKVEPASEVVAGDIAVVTKLSEGQTGDTLTDGGHVILDPIKMPAASAIAAIHTASKGDADKVLPALQHAGEEDPSISFTRDPATNETVVHGLGDVHLQVLAERMKRKYGVDISLEEPRVPYRETITRPARAHHRYKKQSGGAGMFGDCTIEIEPLPRGEGFVWEDKIFGGAIPQQFRPSVEKGVRQTMQEGVISGSPLVDVRVRLVDGSTHPVDGKDLAFQLAGAMAMREAVRQAHPVLLEPVMAVHVTVPDEYTGEATSLFNTHRGRINAVDAHGDGRTTVNGLIPLAEMYSFPAELRAQTQGRGRHEMEESHYEEVPAPVAARLTNDAGAMAGAHR